MSNTKTVGETYRGHSYSVTFEYAQEGDASKKDNAPKLVQVTILLNGSKLVPAKTPGFQLLGKTEAAVQGSVVRYINFLVDGDKGRS